MLLWTLFIGTVLLFLALDLGVFHKNAEIISNKNAAKWTLIWAFVSLCFSGIIYLVYQANAVNNPENYSPLEATLKYITGYVVELSLSADNIFVIAVIFSSFKIAQKHQHRILFWGILGAIVFRGILIFFGTLLVHQFEWISYVFGGFLVFTALKMLFKKDEESFDPKHSSVYRLIGKFIPVTHAANQNQFFILENGKRLATPLFIALLVIEIMDVVFALDSVPAILSITADPFLVFSSNIFAILGLRSLYFFLANMLAKFAYLEYSIIAILSFIGLKMLIKEILPIAEWLSLLIIVLSLSLGIFTSLYLPQKKE
jgi:tellurite resistance protein TerC